MPVQVVSMKYLESMEEVRAVEPNGLNVVSTFSGAGGSCLGYRIAGYKVLWANEFIDAAGATYKLNHDTHLCTKDIRQVTASDIKQITKDKRIDILDGSPPFSSFSTSAPMKLWGKTKCYSGTMQKVDDLFFEYIRIIGELKPRAFIAENVTGLVKGKGRGYYNMIMEKLLDTGYQVKAFVLDASSFGIPQSRRRLFIVGLSSEINHKITAPPIQNRMALMSDFRELDDIVEHHAAGRNKFGNEVWHHTSRPYSTVTASIGKLTRGAYLSANGFVRRKSGVISKLTIAEGRVLSSFPKDFKLTGDFSQQFERIGRAVPPMLMANLAKHMEGYLK